MKKHLKCNKIITHGGKHHADEVLAVAMLVIYIYEPLGIKPKLKRIPHNDFFKNKMHKKSHEEIDADFVLDIGKRYDKETFFDHHQSKNMDSCASLIWKYIKSEIPQYKNTISGIEELVRNVSLNDTGIDHGGVSNLPNIIELNNSVLGNNLNSFMKSLEIVSIMVRGLKKIDDYNLEFRESIKDKEILFGSVMVIEEYNPVIKRILTGELLPNLHSYCYPAEDGVEWYIKTIAKSSDKPFEKNRGDLPKSDLAFFRHDAGFIAKFRNKKDLNDYVEKHIKDL